MKRRITISLEADLERIIRNKQANLLLKANHSVSFSEMLNRLLHEALKKEEDSQIKAKMDEKYSEKNQVSYPGAKHQEEEISVQNENMEIEERLNRVYNRLA